MDENAGAVRRRSVHPALFFFLYFSFGASGGFLTGAVEDFYTAGGVSTLAFGAIISAALAPQMLKVFWAPLVDTLLNPKAWYVLATVVLAAAIMVSATLPVAMSSVPTLVAISVVVALASSFLGMSADSLMAHDTAPDQRGAAGGWSQAGNLGGAGIGISASLAVAHYTHSLPLSGLAVAAGCAACAIALIFAPKSHSLPKQVHYGATLLLVVKDCWDVCRSRRGWLTLLLFTLPLGAGGVAQLFTGIHREWNVGGGLLALSTLINAIATGVAALVGGYICDRMDRKSAYVLFGLLCGAIAAVAAVAPMTPAWFVGFCAAYSAALGMSYAAYSAATLEAIGGGAAATKYTLFASVANFPVWFMPTVDGWVDTHWKASAMLWTELGVAVAGAAVFSLVALASRPRRALAVA
ncbi:MAG TPA: MFS transporter [Caulobacteraceae bacterium]|jgi:MFS family permease